MAIQDNLILDAFAWLLIHLSIGFWCSRIPASWFDPNSRFYRSYRWERGGKIYQRFFRVRAWKEFMPNGGSLYGSHFSIKTLPSHSMEYVERWLRESCRSELCHWLMILPGFLFFLWNSVHLAWAMVAYAVLNNIFPIVLQRFNRPRMQRLLQQLRVESAEQEGTRNAREAEEAYSHSYC